MQPTTGPILPGATLSTSVNATEPQGLAAPQDGGLTAERPPFRRVLNQEQASGDATPVPAGESEPGGSSLPAGGNALPVAESETPLGAGDLAGWASPDQRTAQPIIIGTELTGLPEEGALPILTEAVSAVPLQDPIKGSGGAATVATMNRDVPGLKIPLAEPVAIPTSVDRQPTTGDLPILNNPVPGQLADRAEPRTPVAAGIERAVTAVTQQVSANTPNASAPTPVANPNESRSVIELAQQLTTDAGKHVNSPLRASATAPADIGTVRGDRVQRPIMDPAGARPQPALADLMSVELESSPMPPARPAGTRGLESVSLPASRQPLADGTDMRVSLNVLPGAAATDNLDLGLATTDIVASRAPTPVSATQSPIPVASGITAPQPVVQPTSLTSASAPAQFSIDVPVLDPAWQTAVNERVVWMAGRGMQSAELRLSPAELGPLQVQLAVDERGVNLTINAAHAATREALEGAIPRLRDMLSEHGMNLADANVSDQGVDARQDRDSDGPELAAAGTEVGDADETLQDARRAGAIRPVRDDAVVDLFA